jgi:hypothetical protein
MGYRNINGTHSLPWVIDCFERFREVTYEQIDDHLADLDKFTITSVGTGFLCAKVITGLQETYSNLSRDNNTTAEALIITRKLLERMRLVAKRMEWMKHALQRIPTMEESTEARKRFKRLVKALTWFTTQEAAMLRFDLWIRYSSSLDVLLGYYERKHMAWQISWPDNLKRFLKEVAIEQGVESPLQREGVKPLDYLLGTMRVVGDQN